MFTVAALKLTVKIFLTLTSRILRMTTFIAFFKLFFLGQFVWDREYLGPEPTEEVSRRRLQAIKSCTPI